MAESLVSVLGFDATNAISTLNTLDSALMGYTKAMRKAASATRSYNKAAKGVDTQLRKQSNVIKGFATTTKDLGKTQQKNIQTTKKAVESNEKLKKTIDKVGKSTKKTSDSMVLSWQSVIRLFTLQVIHQAISGITNALQEGSAAARQYQISLAEIETIGHDLNMTTSQLSAEVRRISEAFAIPIDVVAEATYETLSNQVAEASKTFEFLESASSLAIGAVTDLDSSVNLLSSVINAYGFNARDADEISGKLFRTIDLGRIRGEEFANTYGRVLVLASQLGINFDEVNASMATYTVTGLKANEAMTLMTNVMLKLIRPTDALKDRMEELGIPMAEAGIQAFGFQGFLQEITKESGSSATAIGKFFGRIRATRGVMGISNKQAERYAENLRLIAKAGKEDIFRAREQILTIDAKQLEREIEKIKNLFIIDLGQGINKTLLTLANFVGGGIVALKALGLGIGVVITSFILLKLVGGTAFFVLAAGVTTYSEAVALATIVTTGLLTPLTAFIALGVAAAATYLVYNKVVGQGSVDAFKKLEKASKISLNKQIDLIEERQKAEEKVNEVILSNTQKFLFDRQKLFLKDQKRAKRLESLVLTSFTEQVQTRLSAFESFVDGLRDKSFDAVEAIREARDEIDSIGRDIQTFKFERTLVDLDEGEVVAKQITQANKLRREAQVAIRERDFDRAKELQAQAFALNNQALSAADQLKDRTAIIKIEKSITNTYKEQQNLQKSIIADQKRQADIAERERASSEASLNRLKQAVKELDKLEITTFGDPEKAKIAFSEVTQRIEKEFKSLGSKVSISDFLGLQEYIKRAMEPLRDPTTGQKARLDLIIDPNIDLVFETLSTAWKTIPEESRLQVSDILGASFTTGEGFEPLIEAAVEAAKEAKEINNLEIERVEIMNALVLNAQKRAKIEKIITDNFSKRKTLLFGTDVFSASIKIQKDQLAFIKSFGQVKQAISAGDIEGINQQIKALQIYIDLLGKQTEGPIGAIQGRAAGIPALIANINNLINGYKQARDLRNELVMAPEVTGERNRALQELGNTVTQVNQGAFNTEAQVQQANINTVRSIDAKTEAVKRYKQALQPGVIAEKHGITISRMAQGGAVGTDTVPAMLSPGEFVVNAKSTKQFFAQLTAMNAGVKPIFRQSGGSVTNVGDVNITVQGSAEPRQTARETMRAFRRETRRNSV